MNYVKKYQEAMVAFGCGVLASLLLVGALVIGGCNNNMKSTEVATVAEPEIVVTPLPKPSSNLILRPGQTAVILKDTMVNARIPYQGDKLYEGPVLVQRGSMVVKPKVVE